MTESARVIIEVTAGLIAGTPEPEYTRRWSLTTRELEAADNDGEVLAELNGRALGYAAWLGLLPDRINWFRVDWVWL